MKNKTTIIAILAIIVIGFLIWKAPASTKKSQAPVAEAPTYSDYKNTSYAVGGQNVFLKNGLSSVEIVPGTAAKLETRVFGNEIKGDFNGDGKDDIAFFMTQSGNGSGVFYYVAVALQNPDGTFKGTNAIFLGDRIAPQNILYSSGVLAVNYGDRELTEAYTVAPHIGKTKFVVLDLKRLVELTIGKDERLIGGLVTWGGEVREFTPCGEKASWLMGDSPAYKSIKDVYAQIVPKATKPYQPVFAVLIGKTVKPPKDGFGASYKTAFNASQLINMNPSWKCN